MSTLSVLLPVYNAAPYLRQTLNSLLTQTRQPEQIVIVNDGSIDESLEILQQYQRKEQRIQLLTQPNSGVSKARNRALDLCEGDFIALMDADDICYPSRFSQQLKAMTQERLDICGSSLKTFGKKTRTIRYPTNSEQLKWNYIFLGRTIPSPAAMLRRSSIGSTRYREDLSFAEDYGFFLSLLVNDPTLRLGNVHQPLLHYRTHDQQASKRLQALNQKTLTMLLGEILPLAEIHPTSEQLDAHYQIWQEGIPLPIVQLQDYLPLMCELSDWLSQKAKATGPMANQWSALARIQCSSTPTACHLIAQAAGKRWPYWRRLVMQLSRGLR